ncbi:general secretion pathway protein GspB [Desulfurivibrio dismutans]|uniref:general secretion pathway protein GspB n=1 Tax=Desulfurivibrio dismutans TaxID=1398908 RepID=UPI0023DC94B9|nr:general secretion pathway protein GspB [Desulfurivibrio alkaliphilus]MDF1614640.1 general secretion pathway protein GspB [Desulfurivibrio alkaliphilus]
MSYILEALKKSQRERDLGTVPRLETAQESLPSTARRSTRSRLLPVLLLNAALLLGLLGYLIIGQPTPGFLSRWSQEATAPAPAELQPAPATTIPTAETPALPVEPKATTKPPVISPPTAAPMATPVESAPPVPSGPSVPKFSELPTTVRQQITPPILEVHVYSENPSRRFIMIGGRQYQEGDRLPDDLKLEKITPDGVELSHRNQPFHMER